MYAEISYITVGSQEVLQVGIRIGPTSSGSSSFLSLVVSCNRTCVCAPPVSAMGRSLCQCDFLYSFEPEMESCSAPMDFKLIDLSPFSPRSLATLSTVVSPQLRRGTVPKLDCFGVAHLFIVHSTGAKAAVCPGAAASADLANAQAQKNHHSVVYITRSSTAQKRTLPDRAMELF